MIRPRLAGFEVAGDIAENHLARNSHIPVQDGALELLAVKLFDDFFERVLAYVHNGDFALRAFF